MSASAVSQAGEAWAAYYRGGPLSWVDPAAVDLAYLRRLAREPGLRALRAYAGLGPPGSRPRILEAGCGVGLYAFALAAGGYRVAALDYNAGAIQQAGQIAARLGAVGARVALRVDNLLRIQAPDDHYDLVFNQAVLEYFCDDRELARALDEMVRVLRPGGRLVIIAQNTRHPLRRIKRALGGRGFTDQPPVRALTAHDLAARLRRHGLRDVQTDGIDPWKGLLHGIPMLTAGARRRLLTYLLYRALARGVPLPRPARSRLALQFIVAGQKPPA